MTVPPKTAVASKYILDDFGNPPEDSKQVNSFGSADYPYEIIAAEELHVESNLTDGINSISLDSIINHQHAEASASGSGFLPQLPDDSSKVLDGSGNWVDFSQSGVSSWDDLEDKPEMFPPMAHTHGASDLPELGSAALAESTDFAAETHTHGSADLSIPNSSISGSGLMTSEMLEQLGENTDMLVAHTATGASDAHQIHNIVGLITALTNKVDLVYVAALTNSMAHSNIILNGEFAVNQDGLGLTSLDNGYITDGCFGYGTSSENVSVQVGMAGAIFPKFSNHLGLITNVSITPGSTDRYYVDFRIEGTRLKALQWGTSGAVPALLSFWVQSSISGTFGGSLRSNDASRSFPFSYMIDESEVNIPVQRYVVIPAEASGTWETGDSRAALLYFSLGAGSTYASTAGEWVNGNYTTALGVDSHIETAGAKLYITGVDMYPIDDAANPVLRPYIHNSYDEELRECQRSYYEEIRVNATFTAGHICYSTTSTIMSMNIPKLRATPAFSTSGGFLLNGQGSAVVSGVSLDSYANGVANLAVSGSGFTANAYCGLRSNSGTAKLIFNCRM